MATKISPLPVVGVTSTKELARSRGETAQFVLGLWF